MYVKVVTAPSTSLRMTFGYMYLRAGVNSCHNKWERRANYRDGNYLQCIH
ncbi:hypothetical protein [Streptomyces sp. NPDC101234]